MKAVRYQRELSQRWLELSEASKADCAEEKQLCRGDQVVLVGDARSLAKRESQRMPMMRTTGSVVSPCGASAECAR